MPEVPLSGEAPLRLTLSEWMEALAIPGLSVAVVDNYQVVWTQGFGVADIETGAPMTERTLLQAGSIAKPVTAVGALAMVERGELSLDEDINESLTGWRLPDSPLTANDTVSLRRLLAHTAGVTPGGFSGYEPGAELPDLPQILAGAPPANSQAATIVQEPGAAMSYSGLGYTIVQLAMVEAAREPFPELMRERVFSPLRMSSSSFEQPLPAALARRAASGHTFQGAMLPGRWRLHPEMAAAGLWTTPHDLALLAIEIARAKHGASERVLSQTMAREMLVEQMSSSALGLMIGPDGMFWHNGGTEGFRAQLRMLAESGDGIVLLSNSDNGMDVFGAVTNAVAAERQWPNFAPRTMSPVVRARLIASARGVERGLSEYRAMRDAGEERLFAPGDLNAWGYVLLEQQRSAEAVRVFNENVISYPENAYAYDSLGEALLAIGDTEGAARNYRRSLELDPTNAGAASALARIEAAAR